ncbi:MAG TPA: hypothetical protein VE912_24985, partial [Bacteroidales bacterium]|nr:hypothetical protein [Bacteroidales bacterium]
MPKSQDKKHKIEQYRLRYRFQDIYRQIALDPSYNKPKTNREIKKGKLPRVAHCMRTVSSGNEYIEINKIKGGDIAFFENLQTCGSVTGCPVCQGRISEKRRLEIIEACEMWKFLNKENTFLMVTYTIPHYDYQDFAEVRDNFMKMKRGFKAQKSLKRDSNFKPFSLLKKEYHIEHDITSMDITWGKSNGFHIHSHDLYFVKGSLDQSQVDDLKNQLILAWIHQASKKSNTIKLDCSTKKYMRERSVDIQIAETPADYVVKVGIGDYLEHKEVFKKKWDGTSELTKHHCKTSRGNGRFTINDMIAVIAESDRNYNVYRYFAPLVAEYVHGMHGKQTVFWSKGAKAFFNIPIFSDQEIAENIDVEEKEYLLEVKKHEWIAIKRYKKRAEVCIIAGQEGSDAVYKYIQDLTEKAKIECVIT